MNDKKFCNTTCAYILNKSNKIDQFVDELELLDDKGDPDMLIILSKMAGITFDHTHWFDDAYFRDCEGELRVALAERLTEIGGGL